jgi:hypothetical protein
MALQSCVPCFLQALDDVQGQLDGLSSSCGAISSALAYVPQRSTLIQKRLLFPVPCLLQALDYVQGQLDGFSFPVKLSHLRFSTQQLTHNSVVFLPVSCRHWMMMCRAS